MIGHCRCCWALQVTPSDWRAGLRDAPKPCSRRQGLDALLADAARPLAAHLAPLLVPSYTLAQTQIVILHRHYDGALHGDSAGGASTCAHQPNTLALTLS